MVFSKLKRWGPRTPVEVVSVTLGEMSSTMKTTRLVVSDMAMRVRGPEMWSIVKMLLSGLSEYSTVMFQNLRKGKE